MKYSGTQTEDGREWDDESWRSDLHAAIVELVRNNPRFQFNPTDIARILNGSDISARADSLGYAKNPGFGKFSSLSMRMIRAEVRTMLADGRLQAADKKELPGVICRIGLPGVHATSVTDAEETIVDKATGSLLSNRAILEALANGVDPMTGEVFPAGSPYNRPEVIRALYSAVLAMDESPEPAPSPSRKSKKPLPPKHGESWSEKDDQALAAAFDAGVKPADLAKKFERSRGSITSRLMRLGKIALAPPYKKPGA